MHAAGIEPDEERLAGGLGLFHNVFSHGNDLSIIEVFHPLLSERPGVFDLLLAHLAEARIHGGIISVGGERVYHATCAKLFFVCFKAARIGLAESLVVALFGLFLGVEVVQIAKELVEPVHGRQVFIAVSKMVFSKMAGGVSDFL